MVPNQNELEVVPEWQSESVEIRLNKRWPAAEYQKLYELAKNVSKQLQLKSHIWVATSGSTAESVAGIKLVALRKEAFLNSARAVNQHLQATGKDIWAQVLPLSHVGGLGVAARASLSKAGIVSGLRDQKWNADFYYKTLQSVKCTLSALVPTQIYDLIQAGYSAPPSIRAIVIGGGAFPVDLYLQARQMGWPVLPSYGMTETCSQIATAGLETLDAPAFFPKLTLLPHAQARENAHGFLEVTASSLFTCYAQWQDGQMKHWDPKKEDWFTTEDKGQVEDDALKIQGRSQDYIKIGGEAVLLSRLREKLERTVARHHPEKNQEFALLEMPSARLENEVHLVFSSQVNLSDAQEILQAYNETVLPFERLRGHFQVAEIPRTELGKIRYAELRKSIQSRT